MKEFSCYRVTKENGKVSGRLVKTKLADLDPGEVVVKVAFSGINYKDALGATGKGEIFKKFPIVPGIDLSGIVSESRDERFKEGDEILITGCGLGETHDGGYAEYMRVPADWIVPLPKGLSLEEAMIYGTAGFTSALAIHRMEQIGQTPSLGKIVVTGATGGVGSFAIDMLSRRGYEVCAVTGKKEMIPALKELGAHEVVLASDFPLEGRPLESVKWGGAIDNVGGAMVPALVRGTNLWGNVALIGVAGGAKFESTVFPHILRGVNILGVSSANCPMPLRRELWQKLGGEFKPANLKSFVTAKVKLANLEQVFLQMLERKTHGRYVVDCSL